MRRATELDDQAAIKSADPEVDYKNLELLNNCTSDSGKIIPGRNTATAHKQQREVARAVKIARFLALLPYTDKQ